MKFRGINRGIQPKALRFSLLSDVREKSGCVLPLLLLRVANPNIEAVPFLSHKFSNFRQKLVSLFKVVVLLEEKDDDDDDEFKEEIRTKR
jgi:hypothetical protein